MSEPTATPNAPTGARDEPPPELVEFCRREHPRLVGTLSLYCADTELAEDLAQEALARAFLHWDRISRYDSPGGWVHRVAINLANSAGRSARSRRRAANRLAARADTPADRDSARVVAVRTAVAALPKRHRTALVLRYYADLPVREVAALMHCPEGTVKTLTATALTMLRASGLEATE